MRRITWAALAVIWSHGSVAFAQPVPSAPEPTPVADGLAQEVVPSAAEPAPTLPRFELGGRVMSGYRYRLEKPEPAQGDVRDERQSFILKQARISLDAELNDQISAELSLELADAISPKLSAADQDQPAYLRNASIGVRFLRELRLKVGRYKRPVSELQLTSVGKLSVPDRGLLNALLLEDNQWGDRALGAMLWGKFRWAKLEWALSVTESSWSPALRQEGVDLIGRLRVSPIQALSVGVSGGRKSRDFVGMESVGYMGGLDAKLTLGGFRLLVDGILGKQLFVPGRPIAFGGLLLTSFDVPASSRLSVQPTLFLEYADAHSEFNQTEALKGVGGLNLILDEQLRLMPQVALTLPLGTVSEFNPWFKTYEYSLLLSLNL